MNHDGAPAKLWARTSLGPLYAATLFLGYALVILVHPLPPSLGDFADWVYQGVLLTLHLHSTPDTAHALKHYPVPNSTVTVLLGLLISVMPWATAAKIFLLSQLVLAWCGIRALASAAKSPSWIWFVAPGAFFLNVNFWFGLAAFQLGIALLFFFVALIIRNGQGLGAALKLSAMLLLLFLTHMVPFTFACLLLACRALLTRRMRLLWGILPSALLLVCYTVLRSIGGNPDAEVVPTLPFGSFSFYAAYKLNTVLKSFGLVNPGDLQGHSLALWLLGRTGFKLLLLANLAICGLVLWLLANALWQSAVALRKSRLSSRSMDPRTAIWLAALLCVPVYLALPRALLGMSDPGSRVMQVAFWAALFLCPQSMRATAILASASAAIALVGLMLFTFLSFRAVTLPGPPVPVGAVQRLALVPYASVAGFYEAIELHQYTTPVFPTGLFLNVGRDTHDPCERRERLPGSVATGCGENKDPAH